VPKLIPSKKFVEDVEEFRSNRAVSKKIAKTLRLLVDNPHHPGLLLERIVNDPAAWSARVDKKYRISFEPLRTSSSGGPDWSSGIFLLRLLVHDDLYKHPR
jgi:hypothetical protein